MTDPSSTSESASAGYSPPLRLLQYASAWGAPSLDAECTRVQAWLRFCGLAAGRGYALEDAPPASIGALPVLAADGEGLVAGPGIDAWLRARGHDPDARLSAAEQAECAAFTALVRHPLRLALTHSWWADAVNYAEVVRPAFAGSLPFPVGIYLPWTMRRRACSVLARERCAEPEAAYALGEDALRQLSARLGERRYFFGDAPCSLDAAVFAYATAILRCPLPQDRLRSSLRRHANLVRFVERVSEAYFGASAALLPAPAATAAPSAAAAAAAAARPGAPLPDGDGGSAESKRTPKQQRFKRRGRNALLGAAASALLYMLSTDMLGGSEADGEDERYE